MTEEAELKKIEEEIDALLDGDMDLEIMDELEGTVREVAIKVNYPNTTNRTHSYNLALSKEVPFFPLEYEIVDNWIVCTSERETGDIFVAGHLESEPYTGSHGDIYVKAKTIVYKKEKEGVGKFLKSKGITIGRDLVFLR